MKFSGLYEAKVKEEIFVGLENNGMTLAGRPLCSY